MSNYHISFEDYIKPAETNKLNDIFSILDEKDELYITLKDGFKDIDLISELLYSNYFEVTFEKDNSGTTIKAQRKSNPI